MRVAVTGTSGRVGRALADRFAREHEVIELPRSGWDLADGDIAEKIAALDFDLLLHPAAMTSLEACEEQPALAERVNAVATAGLAAACARAGRGMISFSTDYVLDGATPGLHDEESRVAPLSVYASTKRRGEEAVLANGGCVMRVSWVFGPEKAAFPEAIVRKALAGEPLAAVGDKTSLPCFTSDLSEWVLALVERGIPNEVLHACQSGEPTSWHGMAMEVVRWLVETGRLDKVPEVEWQSLDEVAFFRAGRPRHTAMANGRLAERIGRMPRDWREALRAHLSETSGVCR